MKNKTYHTVGTLSKCNPTIHRNRSTIDSLWRPLIFLAWYRFFNKKLCSGPRADLSPRNDHRKSNISYLLYSNIVIYICTNKGPSGHGAWSPGSNVSHRLHWKKLRKRLSVRTSNGNARSKGLWGPSPVGPKFYICCKIHLKRPMFLRTGNWNISVFGMFFFKIWDPIQMKTPRSMRSDPVSPKSNIGCNEKL